jgi:hypothetical protein
MKAVHKIWKNTNRSIDIGFERLFPAVMNKQNEELMGLLNNIKEIINMNDINTRGYNENIISTFKDNMISLRSQLDTDLKHDKEITDKKLLTIDGNIKVVHDSIGK